MKRLTRPFWLLWTASSLSNLADGVLKVALALVAVELTRSPLLVAGLSAALSLPWLICSLPVGALADRVDRRRAMQVAQAIRVVALLTFAGLLAGGAATIWTLYLVALAVGVAEVVYDTCAQTVIPSVVEPDLLPRANGRLYAAELTSQQFVGPAAAGFLVGVGAAVAVATPAALWSAAFVVLALLPGRFRAVPPAPVDRPASTDPAAPADTTATRRRLGREIVEGLTFLWRHTLLRTMVSMGALMNIALTAYGAVLVLYAVGPASAMGLTPAQYGLLLTAQAAAGVVATFVAEPIVRRLGLAATLALSVLAEAAMIVTPAFTAVPVAVGAAMAAGTAGAVIWNVNSVSLRQRVTPDHLRGRVSSAARLVAMGLMPVGALLGGLLAQAFGVRTVFAVMGGLMCVALIGVRVVAAQAPRRRIEIERRIGTAGTRR